MLAQLVKYKQDQHRNYKFIKSLVCKRFKVPIEDLNNNYILF